MNDFPKRYASFDNLQLLKIIEDARSYHPAAVAAAQEEIARRTIPEEEVEAIQQHFAAKQAKQVQKQAERQRIGVKAKGLTHDLLDIVNPVLTEASTTDKRINQLLIGFGLIAAYQLLTSIDYFKFLLSIGFTNWDLGSFIFLLLLATLPIGIFLFWKRNATGWVLLSAFTVYTIVGQLFSFIQDIGREPMPYYGESEGGGLLDLIELYADEPDPINHLLAMCLWAAALWVLGNTSLREKFRINQKSALITILVTTVLSAAPFLLV